MAEFLRQRVVTYEEFELPDGRTGRSKHVDPAVIRCKCSAEVELWNLWLTTCDACGRDYNGSGQVLAPREDWGSETGEHPSDLLNFSTNEDGGVEF